MRRLVIVLASGAAIATLGLACGSSRLPAPTYERQLTSALVEVPYPPPPARVEMVPPRPREGAVWIDGEWQWQGRRWAWRQGRWVEPPRDGVFSPWATVRDANGTLYVAAGAWRTRDGGTLEDPTPIRAGRATAGSMVNPEGEPIGPTTTVPADASPVIVDSGPAPPDDRYPFDAENYDAELVPRDVSLIPDVHMRDALPLAPEDRGP